MSICAVGQSLPQPLAVGGIADRRRALELRRAVGDRLGDDREIVGTGLDRDVDAVGASGAQLRATPRRSTGVATWTRGRAGPIRAASARMTLDRPLLGRRRARAQVRRVRRSAGRRRGGDQLGVLGMNDQAARRAGRSRPSPPPGRRRPAAGTRDAGVDQEALEAEHSRPRAALRARRRCPEPRRPRTRRRRAPGADAQSRLIARASTVVVGGMLLSGMSITVVTPPAAAARVPVSKPSHSVRPGSLMCTCVSTRPGSSTSPSASRTVSWAATDSGGWWGRLRAPPRCARRARRRRTSARRRRRPCAPRQRHGRRRAQSSGSRSPSRAPIRRSSVAASSNACCGVAASSSSV